MNNSLIRGLAIVHYGNVIDKLLKHMYLQQHDNIKCVIIRRVTMQRGNSSFKAVVFSKNNSP